MNKVLGLAVACIMAFAVSAKAELLSNLQTHGELEVHGVWDKNVATFTNAKDAKSDWRNTQTRVTFGLTFDLLDDVHSTVTFVKNDRYWGQDAQSANGVLDTLMVQEANVVIDDVFGLFSAKIGRQFYGDEGSYLIYFGKRHLVEGLPVDAIDALVLTHTREIGGKTTTFEFMYGKTEAGDMTLTPLTDDASNIWGLKAVSDINEAVRFTVGAYNRRDGVVAGANPDNLWAINLALAGKAAGLHYNLDGAFNLGSGNNTGDQTYKGYAYTINLAYPIAMDSMTLTPRVGFAYGSGDTDPSQKTAFRAIAGDYRPGYIFGHDSNNAITNNGSIANLNVITVGLDFQFNEKTTLMADFYNFGVNKTAGDDKTIGQEIDLTLNYAYSENIDFGVYYAKFLPGNWLKPIVSAVNGGAVGSADKAGSYISIRW